MTKKVTSTETYWQERQRELEEAWNRKSRQEIERELKAYYEQSLAHIEKDIRTLYQRFATDNGLDMVAAQRLLMGSEYRVWRMDLQEYVAKINATGDKELLRELNTLAMRSRITRLDALRSETIKEMIQLSEKTERAMSRFLPSAYKDFYYRGLYEIGKTRGLQSAAGIVDSKRIEAVLRTPWSGKNYSERIWHNNAKLGETIQKSIVAAAHRGVPVADMVRDVKERMGVGTSDATRLVRTELNYVQNQAALDSIKDAGMEYYRFTATLDNRTSPMCRSKDGHVFPVEDAEPGTNMPPLHPRCRSIISGSLYAEYKPRKGTRIARDENGKNVFVPAGMRYEDWKSVYIDKKQTVAEWRGKYIQEFSEKVPTWKKEKQHGIMGQVSKKDVNPVHFVCKLDKKIYSAVVSGIQSGGVIITDERIEHIKLRHPSDYESFVDYISQIIEDPDYIVVASKPHTAVVLKMIEENGKKFKVILRLKVQGDPSGYEHSIISFWCIGDTTWRKTLRNKVILYSRE